MIEATGDPRDRVFAKQKRHQEIARLYGLLGKPQQTRFMIVDGPHGYIESMYEAAYEWLESAWPSSQPKPRIEEPRVPVESPEDLLPPQPEK